MNNKRNKLLVALGIVGVTLVGSLGWVLNMGFNRFIFTLFGIPFAMPAAIIAVDLAVARRHGASRLLTAANILFNLSYLCTSIFLPDGMLDSPAGEGPASESYMLFGLIHNSDLYEPFMTVALLAFACFLITLLFQIIWMLILRRRAKKART